MPLVFHIWGITEVGVKTSQHCAKRASTPPHRGAVPFDTGPRYAAVFFEGDSRAVSPEVPPWPRRCNKCETRSCQTEHLCPDLARESWTALHCPPANF